MIYRRSEDNITACSYADILPYKRQDSARRTQTRSTELQGSVERALSWIGPSGRWGLLRADGQNAHEGFLGDFDAADGLHALLTFFLLFEQFALTRDVAAVALGQNVLSHRGELLRRDTFAPIAA